MGLEGSLHRLGRVWAAVPVAAGSASAPPGALGGSAARNHREDPVGLEFLVGLCPPDGLALGQGCLQHPQFSVTSTISGFAPIPAPALPSCSASQPARSSAPLCLSLVRECFSIMQNTILKASHFLQLLVGVCTSSGLFSLRLMKRLPIN